jgi:hypothetical protein
MKPINSKLFCGILGGIAGLIIIPFAYAIFTMKLPAIFNPSLECGIMRIFSLICCGLGAGMGSLLYVRKD